jgi:hypothetical protein
MPHKSLTVRRDCGVTARTHERNELADGGHFRLSDRTEIARLRSACGAQSDEIVSNANTLAHGGDGARLSITSA